jgi:L-fuconolactonase
VTEADHVSWKPADLRPYLDVAFEAFGPQRLMFGSDWPVCLLAAEYERVVGVVDDYLSGHSREVRDAVFGLNAARFYLSRKSSG